MNNPIRGEQVESIINDPNVIRQLVQDTESIDDNLNCGICQELVIEPKECEQCQHLFCKKCIEDWMKKNRQCPYKCSDGMIKLKDPHRFVKSTISQININCVNKDCNAKLQLGSLEGHLKECQYALVKCNWEGCNVQVKRLNLKEHSKNCNYRLLICEQCCSQYKIQDNHNCIITLKNIITNQGNQIQELFVNQEQLIKQLQELEQKMKQIEKNSTSQNKQKKQNLCPRGHQLQWIAPQYGSQCSLCLKQSEIIRYQCQICLSIYCQNCYKPIFNFNKCPVDHQLYYNKEPSSGLSCDFCGKRPYQTRETVYSDRQCDFDICLTCFRKFENE